MSLKCSISQCRNRPNKKALFSIPYENEELAELWKQQLPDGVNFEETASEDFFVCEDHFSEETLIRFPNKCILTKGAVPTIFNSVAGKNKSFLIDHSNNCRFCLRQLSKKNEEVEAITESARKLFFNLTNYELRTSKVYSQRICVKCSKDLKHFSVLKNRLINNQKKLYKIFENFEENATQIISEEPLQIKIEVENSYLQNQFPDTDGSQQLEDYYEDLKDDITLEESQEQLIEDVESVNVNEPGKVTRKRKDKKSFNKERVLCPECGLYFTRASLRAHRERVHLKLKRYECNFCGRKFYLKDAIKEHLKTHIGIRNHICSHCNKAFLTRGTLKMHIDKTHLQKYIVYCEFCSKKFTNKGNFRIHIRSAHTGERPFVCDFETCRKAFFSIYELRTHKNNVHCPPVKCEICSRFFSSPNTLKSHIKLSHCEKSIECQICTKKYHTNYLLRQHMKTHSGEKNYSCSLCGQTYYKSADLNRHIRAFHMKVKLKCEIHGCSSQFARKETYKNHILSHHKDLGEERTQNLLDRIRNMQLPKIDMNALSGAQ